ncbi:MAG TPA: hypothetical protein PLD51_05220 [Pontiellaceae bacterium]|nr:hypothetical protein [Pontiellaceae bacterium]HPR83243.1 hypothetical protein [Pontiellaceae bacterium]
MKNKPLFFLTILSVCSLAQAVIISGVNGTGNTTGTGAPGWDYVGKISSANGASSSVTYLGNSWFVTANHVKQLDNPTGVVLNATAYSIDSSSWRRITNSSGSGADLMLFRVNSNVAGLSAVTIASNTPATGAALTMIGNGMNRAASSTTWFVDTTPGSWVWSTSRFSGWDSTLQGYSYASGTTKRWGSNTADGSIAGIDDGFGVTDMFYTDFDNIANEAQGATYDSGGGVFTGTTNNFQLAGVMLTVGTYNSQPANTAVFGDVTYVADLTAYRDQINQVIPEPATAVLLAGIGIVFGVIKRMRYMYQ